MEFIGKKFSFNQAASFLREYQLVSAKNLFTIWDETEECSVEVYRQFSDGKVVLRYPPTYEENQSLHQLEGNKPEDRYQLIMTSNDSRALFDGTNGKLIDTAGEEIKCFLGSTL